MVRFKRTEIIKFPDQQRTDSHGESDWNRWKRPVTVQEYGAINKIDFCPVAPYYFAVTSLSKVLLYDPIIKRAFKTISKFQDSAYGARFRQDGKLLCVGTTEGQLKVFDLATKTLLRILRGHHTSAVHRCDFTPDQTGVLSFADDKTIGLWDLPSETLVNTFHGHEEYVRSGAPFNMTSNLFVSASYDQTVRLWDKRRGTESVLVLKHGAPVEDVVMLPGDGLVVSAGGNKIMVWDLAGGGRELATLSPHHKTITCLTVAENGASIVSGSLDRQVKRIDLQSFQVTGSLSFPSSLLSVGVHEGTVVGGMADGLVQIREKKEDKIADGTTGGSRRREKEPRNLRYLKYTHFEPAAGDVIVDFSQREVELKHDTMLRKYEYSKALDLTLKPYVQRKKPQYAHSLFYELIRRQGLKTALVGRDEKSILQLLTYLNRYITDPRFTKVLLHVASILVEICIPFFGESKQVMKMFRDFDRKLERELRFIDELTKLQGVMDLVVNPATLRYKSNRVEREVVAKS